MMFPISIPLLHWLFPLLGCMDGTTTGSATHAINLRNYKPVYYIFFWTAEHLNFPRNCHHQTALFTLPRPLVIISFPRQWLQYLTMRHRCAPGQERLELLVRIAQGSRLRVLSHKMILLLGSDGNLALSANAAFEW